MNKKFGRNPIKFAVKATGIRKDVIKNCEKIILKRVTPKDFTATIVRRVLLVKEHEEIYSSARYIQTLMPETKRVQLKSKSPNISIIFTKKSVSVIVQRAYDKGNDLKRLNEIAKELKKYLESLLIADN